jgi:hypothetical protein
MVDPETTKDALRKIAIHFEIFSVLLLYYRCYDVY